MRRKVSYVIFNAEDDFWCVWEYSALPTKLIDVISFVGKALYSHIFSEFDPLSLFALNLYSSYVRAKIAILERNKND